MLNAKEIILTRLILKMAHEVRQMRRKTMVKQRKKKKKYGAESLEVHIFKPRYNLGMRKLKVQRQWKISSE